MIDLLVFPGNVTIAVPGSFNKSLIRTKPAKIITSVYRYIQTAKPGELHFLLEAPPSRIKV